MKKEIGEKVLCGQDASTSDFLDFLFCDFREESGLDDDGLLGQVALAEDLEESGASDVDDWSFLLVIGVFFSGKLRKCFVMPMYRIR